MDIIPILLTSSVTIHDTRVALKNPDERISHTVNSIEKWHAIAPDCPIVICDGSNFDFREIIKRKNPAIQIECLNFSNDEEKVKEFGRGYGEGEIIKFAIENSNTIREYQSFAKCSAKLWVENFNDCRLHWNHQFLCQGVFENHFKINKPLELSYIDTRFYLSSVQFYKENFLYAHHKIDKRTGIGLEEVFKNRILESHHERVLFTLYPIVLGVGGGTGKSYKTSYTRKIREKLKLKLASLDKKHKNLFLKSI